MASYVPYQAKKHGFLFGLKQKTSGISCNHLCQTCVFKSIRKKLSAFLKCGMAHFKKSYVLISRCSKLIAYMNLIKKVMLSNASTPSFGPYAQLSSVV